MLMRMFSLYRKWRGAILLLTGLGLVSLLGFISLGTDLGIIYKRRAELQKAVDAAALAASAKIDSIRSSLLESGDNLVWTDQYTRQVKEAAKAAAKANGVILSDSDITLTPADFPTKVKVVKDEQVNLFFAKMINVKSVNIHVESEAQNQLLSSLSYDLLPWGIPDGKVIQTGDLKYDASTGNFTGFSVDGTAFVPGQEYLLKLGSGVPDSDYGLETVGDKILIPMGDGDQDSDSAYKLAYGFVYWCLVHGFPVEWLINYRGGSFMIDYRGDFFNGTYTDMVMDDSSGRITSGPYAGVKFEIIDALDVRNYYKQAYKVLEITRPPKIAVYTEIPDYESNVVPLGIDYRQTLVDGRTYTLKYNSSKNSGSSITFDETQVFAVGDTLDEATYGMDLNGDGDVADKVKVEDITTVPIKTVTSSSSNFDESVWRDASYTLDENQFGMDLDGDGLVSGSVKICNVTTCSLDTSTGGGGGTVFDETHEYNGTDTLDESKLGIDLDGNGVAVDIVQVKDIVTVPVQEVSTGGSVWDEKIGHGRNYRVKEWEYNMDLNGDGDTDDKVKMKNITNYPTKKVGSTYYLDANRDGDYIDVVDNWPSKYKIDINSDGSFDSSVTLGGGGGTVQYRVDIDGDGAYSSIIPLTTTTGYQVDINSDGDYLDKVSFSGGAILPGPGNFGALAIDGNGANVYRTSLKYGCQTALSVGDVVDTEPGNMAGPTADGIQYRLDNGKVHVLCPIVNNMTVHGRSEVVITGFAAFDLISTSTTGNGNNASAEIVAKYVDLDKLKAKAEDPTKEVVAKVLTQAHIPFDWIHNAGILSGKLYNYDWLHSHHEDTESEVANAIAEWAYKGGFCFAMCWITERLDIRLNQYNEEHGGGTYPTFAFKHEYMDVDDSKARIDDGDRKGFYLDTDYDTMDIFELMAVQDHKNYIPRYGGKTNSFRKAAIKSGVRILGEIDSDSAKYLAGPYGNGRFTFLAGHDPKTTEGYRLILNNIFAATFVDKDWDSLSAYGMTPNFGCLDLNNIESTEDDKEYYRNVLFGYKDVNLKPGDYVYTLPGNIPSYTNMGVTTRFLQDKTATVVSSGGNYDISPQGSVRGVIVPIVDPEPATSDTYYSDNSSRSIIYNLKGRTRVRIKKLALFLLRDINLQEPLDTSLSVNPDDTTGKGIYNGQVRGIFIKYVK